MTLALSLVFAPFGGTRYVARTSIDASDSMSHSSSSPSTGLPTIIFLDAVKRQLVSSSMGANGMR